MKTYELPQRFVDDHASRDLDEGVTYLGTKGRCYLIAMTDSAYSEMLSDADFYTDAVGLMGQEYAGLARSAKATADRLRKAGRPV